MNTSCLINPPTSFLFSPNYFPLPHEIWSHAIFLALSGLAPHLDQNTFDELGLYNLTVAANR